MKNTGKLLYKISFTLSIASALLILVGVIWHRVTGRAGLFPMLYLSIIASAFAVIGIILLCIDIKSNKADKNNKEQSEK